MITPAAQPSAAPAKTKKAEDPEEINADAKMADGSLVVAASTTGLPGQDTSKVTPV